MANIKPYFSYGPLSSNRDLITSTTTYSGVQKRYFSSLDAEIFIGGERLLDIARIDFMYEEKKMPYYGFNSFIPSKIFVGQKLVQGTFAINFTEAGYIAKLLQKIDRSELSSDLDLIGQSCSNENAPLFGLQFDILVGYGGHKIASEASLNNTYLVIQGACINGYQQILDISGEPVMETYSFIAKAIKFDGYKYPERINNNPIVEEDSNDNENKKRSMQLVEERLKTEVDELTEKCSNDKKLLGLIVRTIHSLHKNDGKSHIYVDFQKQMNSDKNNCVAGRVTLTISDNEVNINKEYSLEHTPNTDGHYGVILDKEDTDKIKKKLSTNSQKAVSCSLKFDYILDGELQSPPAKHAVLMIQGLNY